jgi:hypothetical protein
VLADFVILDLGDEPTHFARLQDTEFLYSAPTLAKVERHTHVNHVEK